MPSRQKLSTRPTYLAKRYDRDLHPRDLRDGIRDGDFHAAIEDDEEEWENSQDPSSRAHPLAPRNHREKITGKNKKIKSTSRKRPRATAGSSPRSSSQRATRPTPLAAGHRMDPRERRR